MIIHVINKSKLDNFYNRIAHPNNQSLRKTRNFSCRLPKQCYIRGNRCIEKNTVYKPIFTTPDKVFTYVSASANSLKTRMNNHMNTFSMKAQTTRYEL